MSGSSDSFSPYSSVLKNWRWKVSQRTERLEKLEEEVGIFMNKRSRKLVILGAESVPIFRALIISLVVYLVSHLLPWVIVFFGGESKMLRFIVHFI